MKTYLLDQLILCSLMVYKINCTITSTRSAVTDTNIAMTMPKVVSEGFVEQEPESISKFKKHRTPARPQDYPYHAAITLNADDTVLCQGALVASNWMLTSGSCIKKYAEYVEFLNVVAGTENTFTRKVFVSDIDYEEYHPKFNPYTEVNDLALIKFITPVDDMVDFVKPIELSRAEYPIGTHCKYSTYASDVRVPHKHIEYKLFGLDLTLLDLSSCDGVSDYPKQVLRYLCVGLGDLQFKTTNSNLESEMSKLTHVGSPLVCGNQLYGIKSKYDLFYPMHGIIPWVNTVIHEDVNEAELSGIIHPLENEH